VPAPAKPYVDAIRQPVAPKRVGFTADLGVGLVDPEVAQLCERAAQRLTEIGAEVDNGCPDFSDTFEAFQVLRANLLAGWRSDLLEAHRSELCPEIIWNIEKGLNQGGADVARAERVRTQLYRRVGAFFQEYDLLACPTVSLPPFPVSERFPKPNDGQEHSYIDWMYLTFVLTLTGCPVISVPIGTTKDGRPVGLQLMGRPRADHEVLSAAHLLERIVDVARLVPRAPA